MHDTGIDVKDGYWKYNKWAIFQVDWVKNEKYKNSKKMIRTKTSS